MVRTLIGLLPVFGCGAVMFLCMRMMSGHHGAAQPDASQAEEIERLRKEVADLREELDAARDRSPAPISGR